MKNQEIFNKVSTHLLKQNKTSKRPKGKCLYHGPNNLKCAVGCLIPDHIYDSKMEGMMVEALYQEFPEIGNIISSRNLDLLRALQAVHDFVLPKYWKSSLKIIANKFRLKQDCLI